MRNVVNHSIVEEVASLARQGLGQVTETELDLGWQRLSNRLEQGQHLEPPISLRPQFHWGKWALAGAAAVALVFAAYRLPLHSSDKPLHYMVEGATVGTNETITAASTARVLFSDESSLAITLPGVSRPVPFPFWSRALPSVSASTPPRGAWTCS